MTRLPIMLCSFSVLLSLFAGVSAEETISISVNPGWMDWEGRDCETVTDENGTWEDCEYYEVYQTNITANGWKMDVALGENFTFAFIAANLENGTEYLFSYELILVRYNNAVTNASHQFIANNTEEYVYNLTGQLISEYEYPYTLDNCSGLMASVSFVKNPNAENGTGEELAKFSTYFSPSGRSMDPLCQISYNGYNSGGGLLNIFGLCLSPILFLFTVSKMFSLFFQPSDTEVADNTSRIDVVTNSNTRALFWLIMMFVSVIMFFMSMIVMW
jgi:hypothetical protein